MPKEGTRVKRKVSTRQQQRRIAKSIARAVESANSSGDETQIGDEDPPCDSRELSALHSFSDNQQGVINGFSLSPNRSEVDALPHKIPKSVNETLDVSAANCDACDGSESYKSDSDSYFSNSLAETESSSNDSQDEFTFSSSEESEVSEEKKKQNAFRQSIADWALKHNTPRTHVTSLLKSIREHFDLSFLPSDYRTLLKTPRQLTLKS